MKKLFFSALCACALLTSCVTTQTVTKVAEPNTEVAAKAAADMVVSPTRISYTYVPTAETKKTSFDNILQTAVEEALRENGNADLLVDLKYTYQAKGFFVFQKVVSVTVTGFPAKYTGFHSLRLKGYTPEGVAMYEEVK